MMSQGGAGVAGACLRSAVTAASRQADVDAVDPGLAGAVDAFPLYRVAHDLLLYSQAVTPTHTLASSLWRTQRTCTAPQTPRSVQEWLHAQHSEATVLCKHAAQF